MAHIPDPSLALCNSSPRYNNYPPLFLCAGFPINFDHSATDPDGDSLAYELCDPFDGASQLNPMPQPPAAPPFPFVPWQTPYSATYPMNAAPPLAVNVNTGWLTGTAQQIGQWVVAVCCKEYRNGQLLSVNKRDFQFNVVNCPPIPVVSIPAQTTFCFGMTVQFQNNSINGTTWHWDFGEATLTNDTSNVFAPSWTYSQPGVYNVMLIANPGTPCADTGWTTFYIYPLLAPNIVTSSPQCITGNSFNFTAGGQFQGNGTFTWNFGPNATPGSSSAQNPTGITYSTPGWHTVILTVTENNCTASDTDSVLVIAQPVPYFNPQPITGCAPLAVQFTDSSITGGQPTVYIWNFGDGNTSSQASPIHTYTQPGTYNITLTITVSGACAGTYTFSVPNMVTVYPSPTAMFTANPTTAPIANPVITFTDQSSGGTTCTLNFGDNTASNICNITHQYTQPGTYTVTQIVTNQYGCTDTFSLIVEILPEYYFWIPNCFTPNGDGLNETFFPVIAGVEKYRFYIFDRWGEIIFDSKIVGEGWDGRYMGNLVQQDVYVWKIEFTDVVEYKQHRYIGHVSVVK
jgi:gliding motility-associated-like protein